MKEILNAPGDFVLGIVMFGKEFSLSFKITNDHRKLFVQVTFFPDTAFTKNLPLVYSFYKLLT